MINTARGAQPRLDWSKGAVSLNLAHAAVRTFGAYDAWALRIVGCHHPLMEVASAPVTGDVHRGQAAAKIFCQGGVDVVLSGHVHNPFAVALPFCDAKTYAVGAGTLSRRLRGTPAGFNVLDVGEGAVTVTALGWGRERLRHLQAMGSAPAQRAARCGGRAGPFPCGTWFRKTKSPARSRRRALRPCLYVWLRVRGRGPGA